MNRALMNPIVTRVLNLISQAITLLANGEYAQSATMLRKAANQLDEIS